MIVYYLVVGLLIGAAARFLLPGRDPVGLLGTLAIGVFGAVAGGYLWNALLPGNDNQGVAVFASLVVSTAVLAVVRRARGLRG